MESKIGEYIDELRTIKKEKVDNSRFLGVEAYSCLLNNGQVITREKIVKNGHDGSASIILPVTLDGRIILAIEPRVFTERTVDIGLPAGYIECGEDPVEAAKRELLEETGYKSDNLIFLGSYYQDSGCSGALNHYFLALDCVKVSEQKLDEHEFIKYILVNYEELEELISGGYIKGLNSAYAIEKGKTYLKRRGQYGI